MDGSSTLMRCCPRDPCPLSHSDSIPIQTQRGPVPLTASSAASASALNALVSSRSRAGVMVLGDTTVDAECAPYHILALRAAQGRQGVDASEVRAEAGGGIPGGGPGIMEVCPWSCALHCLSIVNSARLSDVFGRTEGGTVAVLAASPNPVPPRTLSVALRDRSRTRRRSRVSAEKTMPDAPVVVAPLTEASPEALATAQATLDAQLVTFYASLPGRCDVYRQFGSAPDGVTQRVQSRV